MQPHCGSWKRAHFSNVCYETGTSKLADENAKCWIVVLYELELLRFAGACGETARTRVKGGKTRLLPLVLLLAQEIILEQVFYWSLVGWAMIRNCWGLLRWDDRRSLLSRSHASVFFLAFLQKIKLLIINSCRESSCSWCFCRWFTS